MGMLHRASVKMQTIWICVLMVVFMPGFSTALDEQAQATADQTTEEQATAEQATLPNQEKLATTADRRAILLDVQGPIGPATAEYLVGSLEKSLERNAELVIIRMDTPGGLDASTRDIIKAILNSPVPVATYVTPGGARAASAGTYILYASHIADRAELAVREAASITAEKALEIGVIDLIAVNLADLLKQVDGKTIDAGGRTHMLDTSSLTEIAGDKSSTIVFPLDLIKKLGGGLSICLDDQKRLSSNNKKRTIVS